MADVDKGLYAAPIGVEEVAENEEAIEIEIEDPESVTIGIGDTEIVIDPDAMEDDEFNANLAEELDDKYLAELSSDLLEDFTNDVNSRKDWLETYVDGLELLGLKIEERSEPWEGACAVYHPLLSEALVKFQAETMMETFPAAGPVKTSIIGKETPECMEAAARVQENMNYQLMDKMPEYRPEHERMLWGLGLAGNAFKKVYYDPALERQVSIFVPAEDMVVPYGASNLETAERVTHVMRKTEQELHTLQHLGFYRDIELGEPSYDLDEVEKKIAEQMGFDATNDDRYKILEMNVNLDLEGYEDEDKDGKTGIALPYIVTIDKGTTEILSIRRNWKQEDELQKRREHFVHYGYIPGFGFYCFGLIHLIGGFSKSGTMLLRQLVDAGTLSNLPGGFKARGLRIKGDDTPIGPGEFRDVDAPSGSIRDNIMMLPYKEPSQVLSALMDKIINEGRRFASAADMKVSDMSANSPVGSTLAILERTLKVMSAVNARIYYSMKKEFGLLKNIIADYTDPDYQYDPSTGTPGAKQSDYEKVNLIPVADPNAATMAQKVVQYQAVMQMAQQNPDIYDLPELNRQMLDVLGVKNAEKLIPNKDDIKQLGPVTENMNIINGKPVKAFLDQDHEAHIAVHMAFTDDPLIRKLVGQSTKAGMIQAAMEAHIAEHVAFQYRLEIERKLGVPLPPMDEPLPVDIENEVARLTAEAAPKVLGDSSLKASEEERQQQAQDPVLQMQQAELQIKQEEAKTKAQKVMADIELDKAKLELDKQKATIEVQKDVMLAQTKIKSTESIAGAKIGAEAEMQQKDITTKEVIEGAKLGAQAINKEKDMALRSEESRLRNETIAHTQKLKDGTQVDVTKLKDETQLNKKE
jgi:chaperonin GroES